MRTLITLLAITAVTVVLSIQIVSLQNHEQPINYPTDDPITGLLNRLDAKLPTIIGIYFDDLTTGHSDDNLGHITPWL